MNVLFAPDYTRSNPYQALLATELAKEGVYVDFLRGYRRVLPLTRGLKRERFDIFHLHWPEVFFSQRGDLFDFFRITRFPFDLAGGLRGRPLVVTAHNLYPHAMSPRRVHSTFQALYKTASMVIAHSAAAAELVSSTFSIAIEKLAIIPHGDMAAELPSVPTYEEAAESSKTPARPYALIFGGLQPYKGIEEIVEWWSPGFVDLWISGESWNPVFEQKLRKACAKKSNIFLRNDRLNPMELALWIVGSQVVVLNHVACLTSGAAALARSLDVPLLIPKRLVTVDLDEPHPRVFRFDGKTNFEKSLASAIRSDRSSVLNLDWRKRTAWRTVAEKTARAYREAAGI